MAAPAARAVCFGLLLLQGEEKKQVSNILQYLTTKC